MEQLDFAQYIDQAPALIIKYGSMLLVALLIFVIGKMLARAVSNGVVRAMTCLLYTSPSPRDRS